MLAERGKAMGHRQSRTARRLVTAAALIGGALLAAAPASAASAFKKIVDSNTPIPGGGGATFNVFLAGVPAVSGDRVVFLAGNETYWTATIRGHKLRPIVDLTTRVPGGHGATFHQGRGGTFVQIHGNTVVFSGIDCDFCNSGSGLYALPVGGGRVKRLVDVSDARPDDPTLKFGRFTDDFHVNGGHVVFANTGGAYAVPVSGGGANTISAGPCPLGDYCGLGSPTLDDVDAQGLVKASNGFSNAKLVRFKRAGGLLGIVADRDTHAPKTPAAYHFDEFFQSFDLPVIDRNAGHNFAVFKGESIADSAPRITGIYSRGSAGFVSLVDTTTHVPGGKGRFVGTGFTDSGPKSLAAANGIVVFRGLDSAGKLGIYAVSASGGAIRKIIAQGDPINGTTVDTVEPRSLVFQRGGFDGTTLVFFAQYAGNTGRGLFSTTVELP
jgi:hypothetical protein